MSKYFWYSPATSVTGKALAERLNLPHGTRHPRIAQDEVICWGARLPDNNSKYRIRRMLHINYLNNVFSICRNTDKGRSLKAFYEAGIAPKIKKANEILQAIDNGEISYPVVGRKRSHIGGRDAKICLSKADIRNSNSNHYVKYIPSAAEYRIHVFQDSIIRASKKVRSSSDEVTTDWIRSRDNGWRMRHIDWHSVSRTIIDAAKKAVKLQSLDFGAVDIIKGEDNNPYVLEVNTGPGLDDRGLEIYTERLQEFIQHNFNN